MALPILDGNQSATTLSTILAGGEHTPAHTVVSLGSTAISNITSAVSGSVVSISNFPATQPISGSISISGTPSVTFSAVSISNFPVTQTIAGTVTANLSKLAAHGTSVTKADNQIQIVGGYLGGSPTNANAYPIAVGDSGQIVSEIRWGSSTQQIADNTGQALPVKQCSGSSVTIGSLPAISGTVTANVPLVSNTPVNQMQALPVVLITDEGTGAYDTGQQLPVEIKTIATSVTIGSLPAISGTVTANIANFSEGVGGGYSSLHELFESSVLAVGSLPSISGTVTVGAVPNGSLTTRFGTPTTANTAFATSAVTNSNRKYLLIQNVTTGSNVITVGIGFTPTTTQGIQLTAGAGITFESSYIPTGAVRILSSVTASNFTILEA